MLDIWGTKAQVPSPKNAPYQSHMDGELHSDANRCNQDDHRHSAQLDPNEAHHAEEFNGHQSQDHDLEKGTQQLVKLAPSTLGGQTARIDNPNVALLEIGSNNVPVTEIL